MPSTKRHIATYGQIGYTAKAAHKHHFPVDFSAACNVSIQSGKLSKEQIVVAVTNTGAGHDLPTGVFGNPEVILEFRILDGDKEIFFRQETLSQTAKNAIKASETRQFFYNFRSSQKKSFLMQAKVFFRSVTVTEPIRLAEREQYLY